MEKYYKIKTLVSSVVLLSSLALAGCGGGGSDSSAKTPDGIYSAAIQGGEPGLNGAEKVIVYNKRLMIMSEPGTLSQQFDGVLTINDNLISSNNFLVYQGPGKPLIATLILAGEFEEGVSMNAAFSDSATVPNFSSGTISFTAEPAIYDLGSGLSRLAFNWVGAFAGLGDMQFTVNASGDISGVDDNGCSLSGRFTVKNASVNAYTVSLISSGGCSSLPDSTYTGLAWTEESNSKLYLMVANGINARSVIMTKY